MSTQKLLVGTLITLVYIFILDYLWYGILMSDYFISMPGVDRDMPLFPWLILGMLIMSYAFCAIYLKGREKNKPLVSQGINYGLLVLLLMFVPMAFIRYAVVEYAPLSEYLVDLAYRVVQILVLGIIVAKYFGLEGARPGKVDDGGN
jgi:hypothetical protein